MTMSKILRANMSTLSAVTEEPKEVFDVTEEELDNVHRL